MVICLNCVFPLIAITDDRVITSRDVSIGPDFALYTPGALRVSEIETWSTNEPTTFSYTIESEDNGEAYDNDQNEGNDSSMNEHQDEETVNTEEAFNTEETVNTKETGEISVSNEKVDQTVETLENADYLYALSLEQEETREHRKSTLRQRQGKTNYFIPDEEDVFDLPKGDKII